MTMTLAEWGDKYSLNPQQYREQDVFTVPFVNDIDARIELHHLSDYFVSSYEAGTYWMCRRKTTPSQEV